MARKWFDGRKEDSVLALLYEVWAVGGSDAEASFYADILPCTLSRYLDTHPDVEQRKLALKERPVLLARRAVIDSFDGHEIEIMSGKKKRRIASIKNPDMALKFLERIRKKEFSTLQKIEGDFNGNIETSDPVMEALKNDIGGLTNAINNEVSEIEKLKKALKKKPRKK